MELLILPGEGEAYLEKFTTAYYLVREAYLEKS